MIKKLTDIYNLRNKYMNVGLHCSHLTTEPMLLFKQWFKEACNAFIPDANAMNVSTVDNIGQTYQRLVLLKSFDNKSMVFYTNLSSRKAYHILHNPRISLHFPWHILGRQVLVLGKAEKLSITDTINYFYSRPKDSQISAWVSQQSSFISSRRVLEDKFQELKKKFKSHEVPVPKFWGGYRVIIDTVEFWQSRQHRLHDRFLYQYKDGVWLVNRLAP